MGPFPAFATSLFHRLSLGIRSSITLHPSFLPLIKFTPRYPFHICFSSLFGFFTPYSQRVAAAVQPCQDQVELKKLTKAALPGFGGRYPAKGSEVGI